MIRPSHDPSLHGKRRKAFVAFAFVSVASLGFSLLSCLLSLAMMGERASSHTWQVRALGLGVVAVAALVGALWTRTKST